MKNLIEMSDIELLDSLQEFSIGHARLTQAKSKPIPGISPEEFEEAASVYQTIIDLIRSELLRRLRKEDVQ